MDEQLKQKFTEEFFEEYQFDPEFRRLFEIMLCGMTPYEVIEHLFISRREVFRIMEEAVNKPYKVLIVSEERLNELKQDSKITDDDIFGKAK